jgi:putative phosphoesterase
LPERVFEAFAQVAMILHAGDVNTVQTLDDLRVLAPVHAVYGNNDGWEVMQQLPTVLRIPVEDSIIGITHGDIGFDQRVPPWTDAPGNSQTAANAYSHFASDLVVNCIVFGHSHRPLINWHQDGGRRTLMINPGSPTDRRFAPHYSLALLRVDGATLNAELITW